MSRGFKLALFAFFVVLAPILPVFTGIYSFVQDEHVSFCASCHTMTPWIEDLKNPKSRSLAAIHYRNGFIPYDQCYTCHVDYGFMGPIDAKLKSVRDVAVYYIGNAKPQNIRLSKPYPNGNCLHCHVHSSLFAQNVAHRAEMGQILADQIKCATCHRPIHRLNFESAARSGLTVAGNVEEPR